MSKLAEFDATFTAADYEAAQQIRSKLTDRMDRLPLFANIRDAYDKATTNSSSATKSQSLDAPKMGLEGTRQALQDLKANMKSTKTPNFKKTNSSSSSSSSTTNNDDNNNNNNSLFKETVPASEEERSLRFAIKVDAVDEVSAQRLEARKGTDDAFSINVTSRPHNNESFNKSYKTFINESGQCGFSVLPKKAEFCQQIKVKLVKNFIQKDIDEIIEFWHSLWGDTVGRGRRGKSEHKLDIKQIEDGGEKEEKLTYLLFSMGLFDAENEIDHNDVRDRQKVDPIFGLMFHVTKMLSKTVGDLSESELVNLGTPDLVRLAEVNIEFPKGLADFLHGGGDDGTTTATTTTNNSNSNSKSSSSPTNNNNNNNFDSDGGEGNSYLSFLEGATIGAQITVRDQFRRVFLDKICNAILAVEGSYDVAKFRSGLIAFLSSTLSKDQSLSINLAPPDLLFGLGVYETGAALRSWLQRAREIFAGAYDCDEINEEQDSASIKAEKEKQQIATELGINFCERARVNSRGNNNGSELRNENITELMKTTGIENAIAKIFAQVSMLGCTGKTVRVLLEQLFGFFGLASQEDALVQHNTMMVMKMMRAVDSITEARFIMRSCELKLKLKGVNQNIWNKFPVQNCKWQDWIDRIKPTSLAWSGDYRLGKEKPKSLQVEHTLNLNRKNFGTVSRDQSFLQEKSLSTFPLSSVVCGEDIRAVRHTNELMEKVPILMCVQRTNAVGSKSVWDFGETGIQDCSALIERNSLAASHLKAVAGGGGIRGVRSIASSSPSPARTTSRVVVGADNEKSSSSCSRCAPINKALLSEKEKRTKLEAKLKEVQSKISGLSKDIGTTKDQLNDAIDALEMLS